MKNEKRKKSLNITTAIKFFTLIFGVPRRIYFAQKHSLGKCSLQYYISSKVLFRTYSSLEYLK